MFIKVKANKDYFDTMSEDEFKTSRFFFFMDDTLTYPDYENYKNEHPSEDYKDLAFSINHLKDRTIRFILKTTGWLNISATRILSFSEGLTSYENYCLYDNLWTLTMPFVDTYENVLLGDNNENVDDNQNVDNNVENVRNDCPHHKFYGDE